MHGFDRITFSPDQMGGRPCIRGLRVTVGLIVGQIGVGISIDQLLIDYPDDTEILRFSFGARF